MIIGVVTAQLNLNGISSLKQKRSIVKSVIGRLQNRFNISIAEVDRQDSKIVAVIGIAIVANEKRFINQQIDKIIEFMQNDGRFYLGTIEREIY